MHAGFHTDSISFLILEDVDPIRTPGYPLFIEFILSVNDLFSLSTNYLRIICLGQLFILGILNCYLIYRISKYLTKSGIFALVAGLIYNLDYFVIGFEFQILTETLSITLLLAVIFFYFQIFEGKKYSSVIAGILSVFLLLTRPTFLLVGFLFPLASLIGFFPWTKKREFYRKYGWSLLIFFLINIVCVLGFSLKNKMKHDYFGVSNLMPYQLRYYTNSFFDKYRKGDDERLNQIAGIYLEELNKSKNKISAVSGFHKRLQDEMNMSDIEITSAFLRINLKLIKDNPGDYLKLLPSSMAMYYKSYGAYGTSGNIKKFINQKTAIGRFSTFCFRFFKKLFTDSVCLWIMILIAPAALLLLVIRNKKVFHGWLLLEVLVNYNFLVSVLSTRAGINNLRYRAAVEPFILLIFYAFLFYLGKRVFDIFRKKSFSV